MSFGCNFSLQFCWLLQCGKLRMSSRMIKIISLQEQYIPRTKTEAQKFLLDSFTCHFLDLVLT